MPDQKEDAVRATASMVSGDSSIPDETKNLSINNTHRFDLSPTDNGTGQVD